MIYEQIRAGRPDVAHQGRRCYVTAAALERYAALLESEALIERRIIPGLGRRRLRGLTADDVDVWLAHEAKTASSSTLSKLMSILRRSIDRQMARDRVKRKVILLC
ncbi:hypothetical protein [Terrabacter sp. RAF57]|uniref:hypothetical protein n=1 Tax=Terrabacter sp. RAF57 TaxID=3233063 RepID=UPI003F998024